MGWKMESYGSAVLSSEIEEIKLILTRIMAPSYFYHKKNSAKNILKLINTDIM